MTWNMYNTLLHPPPSDHSVLSVDRAGMENNISNDSSEAANKRAAVTAATRAGL